MKLLRKAPFASGGIGSFISSGGVATPNQHSGLAAWYRFNQGITSVGSFVSQWDDQSGNARHLVQATAANRPFNGSGGSNLVTNGTFDADTNWTKGTGWSIGSGVASCDGTQTAISELTTATALSEVLSAPTLIFMTFTVSGYSAGTITPRITGSTTTVGTARSANGTYTEVIAANNNQNVLRFRADADFVGSIDNVIIQKITADGSILFDGIAHFLKTDAFTLNQPTTVYFLGKQVTWTALDTIYDGDTTAGVMRLQQLTTTPNLALRNSAGTAAANNTELALNTYGVVTAVFNGASSLLQVNNGTPVIGDFGASTPGGFVLGANAVSSDFSNIQVKEILIYNVAHDAGQRASLVNYLTAVNQ